MTIAAVGLTNIPELVGQLRAAADLLERIAGIFSPAPQPTPMPLLVAPTVEVAVRPVRQARKAASGKLAKRAAPKATTGKKRGVIWTEERRSYLRQVYPRGTSLPEMLAALNRLKGPEIAGTNRICIQAAYLGVGRGGKPRQARRPPEVALPAPAPVRDATMPRPAPAASLRRSPASLLVTRDGHPSVARRQLAEAAATNAVAAVSWSDAMAWAHRNKVVLRGTEEQDLLATNLQRRKAHLPPFMIVDRRGPLEPLPDPGVGGSESAAV